MSEVQASGGVAAGDDGRSGENVGIDERFEEAIAAARACRLCASAFALTPTAHKPRPVFQLDAPRAAPILLVGQAPGVRAHRSGLPFDDPSGDRLRSWLGVDRAAFYDPRRFAILPMGFCFPGHDAKGGDLPPPIRCAEAWRDRLFAHIGRAPLMVLIGRAAIAWHAPGLKRRPLGEIVGVAPVEATDGRADETLVLPHPSWRNNAWLKKHPQVEESVLPKLRARVAALLDNG